MRRALRCDEEDLTQWVARGGDVWSDRWILCSGGAAGQLSFEHTVVFWRTVKERLLRMFLEQSSLEVVKP